MAENWSCARCRQAIAQGRPWHWKPAVDDPVSHGNNAKILVQRVHSLLPDCERAKEGRRKQEAAVCGRCGQSIRRGEGKSLEQLLPGVADVTLAFIHSHADYCLKATRRRAEAPQSA
jgi:uncharacterized paraquat-inducible protein A